LKRVDIKGVLKERKMKVDNTMKSRYGNFTFEKKRGKNGENHKREK
jgi:hypothetical protein